MPWGTIVVGSIVGIFALIISYGIVFDRPDRDDDRLSLVVLFILMIVMGVGLYVGHLPLPKTNG